MLEIWLLEMMNNGIAIHWFRQDLRLTDNPSLYEAGEYEYVLPIYILDDENAGFFKMGSASRLWLHHALTSLNNSLENSLTCYQGEALQILLRLVDALPVKAVFWNRCYEPWRMKRDKKIKQQLQGKGIFSSSFNGSLLWEPWEINKTDGTPYKVFTPFYQKGCLGTHPPRRPIKKPKKICFYQEITESISIDKLGLLPKKSWPQSIEKSWQISETGAHNKISFFLEKGLSHYKRGRDYPSKPYPSRISPYLHFGQISPHQIWEVIRSQEPTEHTAHFCSELGWREFSYNLLFYNPELPWHNFQQKFERFPWEDNRTLLEYWRQGKTGIPMVDAGMRELLQTGYMHNRMRMIVGSFLVKNLLLHWHHGERWFWECLVDADLANNSSGWQWIAGCGADAAPYFRVFNPVTQGQNFDADGTYIRRFIPEIAALPNTHLFSPWKTPKKILQNARVILGQTYPYPIVDLQDSRKRALAAFKSLSEHKTTILGGGL